MALLFVDGMDLYGAAGELTSRGYTYTSATISASGGRFGGQAVSLTTNGGDISRPLAGSPTTVYTGAWVYVSSDLGDSDPLLSAGNGAELRAAGTGELFLYHSTLNGGAALATGLFMSLDTWHFVEFALASTTLGVKLDGGTEVTSTGGTLSAVSSLTWHTPGYFSSALVDDWYICDDAGTANNTYLGPIRIDTLAPTSDDTATFTTTTGTSHYTEVDDAAPDGDTTYVEGDTSGQQDLFGIGTLPSPQYDQVVAVQVAAKCITPDGGAQAVYIDAKSGATVGKSAAQSLASSYTYYQGVFEQDPDTAAQWTISGVEAGAYGVEVV